MAKPGEYDAVIVLGVISDRPVLSNAVRVSVRKPKDKNEETAALLKWLTRAEPMQRIRIAERLLERGDRSGIDTVLAMLSGKSANKLYSASPAYAFVWKHAGERGEHLLMDLLKRQTRQSGALSIIEEVYRSDRAIALLQTMLADRRETARDFSGWCERPRICDVTASWLCGYTDHIMKFPKVGSTQERDRAVATVIVELEKDPAHFEVLTRER